MPATRRDDSEASALPTVGYGQALQKEAAVRVVATRLQRSSLYRPFLARTGVASGAGVPGQLYISLRPALRQGARTHKQPPASCSGLRSSEGADMESLCIMH